MSTREKASLVEVRNYGGTDPTTTGTTSTPTTARVEQRSPSVVDRTTEEESEELPPCARDGITTSEMLRHIAAITLPTLVGLIFMFATQAITMSYVGHRLGFEKLAQFSVGLSVYNILGASIGVGFCGALDTLAPQAFGRNPNSSELGILVQRAIILNIILWVPLTLFYYHCEPLLALVYPAQLAMGAAQFLRACPIYLMMCWTASIFNRVYPAQGLAMIPLYANICGTMVAVCAGNYFLDTKSGIADAVFVLMLTQLTVNLIFIATAVLHPRSLIKKAPFPAKEALEWEGMTEYGKLGCASVVATCCEWWTYEIVQVICAQLGSAEVASFTILLNILVMFFSVAFGIGISGATLVGNCLGANRPELAVRYMHLVFQVTAAASVVTFSVLYFKGLDVVKLYTRAPAVLATVEPIVPLFAVWHLIDNAKSCLAGIYRGCGYQEKAAKLGLLCLWGVGLTCTVAFTLKPYHKGMPGVIFAQILGVGVLCPQMVWECCYKWDFPALAAKASKQDNNHSSVDGEDDGPEEG